MPLPQPQSKTIQRHKFQLNLPKSHFDELQQVAGFEDRSVASMIRQLVAIFLRDKTVIQREITNRDLQSQRHKFQMYLDRDHFDELQQVAGFEDRSVASMIRQIVAVFLCDQEAARKESAKGKNRRK